MTSLIILLISLNLNEYRMHTLQYRILSWSAYKSHNVKGPTLWYGNGWHGFEQLIINNATDEWSLSVCSCKRTTFLVFSLTADYTFVHFNVLV